MKIKGIIMAGGQGTRLAPLTTIINKHLLPIYNKPMIYYSLSTLIYTGVKEVLIICNVGDEPLFAQILKEIIKKYKIKIYYQIQQNTGRGIAEGLMISKDFIMQADKIVFILGDNFFYGRLFPQLINSYLIKKTNKSYIFVSQVTNPKEYGVAYFKQKKLIKIVEKPNNPKSNFAVTGLYIYNKNVLKVINQIKPSRRNELEITSVNNALLKNNHLNYVNIGRGTTWFDLGSYENIYQCAEFIQILEKRQGLKVCDL
jgi:glucose-1-phosphate thymidylyltransferase